LTRLAGRYAEGLDVCLLLSKHPSLLVFLVARESE
jgi:hypothetical protein